MLRRCGANGCLQIPGPDLSFIIDKTKGHDILVGNQPVNAIKLITSYSFFNYLIFALVPNSFKLASSEESSNDFTRFNIINPSGKTDKKNNVQ